MESARNQAVETVNLVTQELETQSLNAIVAGFSFAAAMSWMDLVRWVISQVIKVPKNGGTQYTLTHDRVSRVHSRVQACSARLRDYPLIGLPFIRKMSIIPINNMIPI